MNALRIGFIGGGEIAHNRALPGAQRAAGVELRAMADVSAAVREQWRRDAPEVRLYEDPQALLDDRELDAVYVALPNFLHKEWTVRAARAGKHVLCEKPLAMNAADAREMAAACERAGVRLMAAYMILFNPLVTLLKDYLDSGRLGRLQYIHGQFSYSTFPREGFWRMDPERGGGPLHDVGIYVLLLTRHLTGQPLREAAALGFHRRWPEGGVPDAVVAACALADGTPMSLEAAFTHGGNYLRFDCEDGVLTLEDAFTQCCAGRLHGSANGVRVEHAVEQGVFPEQNYQREFEHLAECVRERREPVCSGRLAVLDCAALDAIVRSIRSGKRERVEA